jgi:hypothetical protein
MRARHQLPILSLLLLLSSIAPAPAADLRGEEVPIPLPGRFTSPVPSPDGEWLAFAPEGYRGLHLLELSSGKVVTLSRAAGSGFRPAWSADGKSVAFRTKIDAVGGGLRIVVGHLDGSTETASPILPSISLPRWNGDELLFERFDGASPETARVGPGSKRVLPPPFPVATPEGRLLLAGKLLGDPEKVYFLPVVSADGERFVVECLDGHLYLGRTGGERLEELGIGSHPSFVGGGEAILFERTGDDGHALTSGDLWLLDLASRKAEALTDSADRIERRPASGGDGKTIWWEEDGKIFRGWRR